ncbi:MAG: glycerophosphodiester phosphodiesterase [Alphaproteobacteria bacterium]
MRIVAHRGASATARENSLAAAMAAIAVGADAVEMDARLSADGVPHVSHDPDLSRLAASPARIAELSAAEIATFRAPDGEPFVRPLADLVMAVVPHLPAVIDIKVAGEGMLSAIMAAVPGAAIGRLVLGVRNVDDAAAAGRLAPAATVLGLLPDPDASAAFAAAGGRIMRLWEKDATPARIAAARGAGLDVWVTAGTPRGAGADLVGAVTAERLRLLRGLGLDGVLVNDPAAARAALNGARG